MRWPSRAVKLKSSMVLAQFAVTYAEMAAAREDRLTCEQEHTRAERMRVLSGSARDLSARFRRGALASTGPVEMINFAVS